MSECFNFAVRRAVLGDLATVQLLFERFYTEEGFADSVERVSVNLPQLMHREDTVVFVAEDSDGIVIGVAAMSTAFGLEVGPYAEVEDMYVLPKCRRRGVGDAMVEHCVSWAAERGCAHVEIVVTPESPSRTGLINWYAKRGFRNTGRVILERYTGAGSRELCA